MADEKKPVEPKITAADFWRIWVQLHFPGNVSLMSDPEIFAASFMVPGARPDSFFVEAWIEVMKKEAFAGRADMFSPTDAEIARENARILKAAGVKLQSIAPVETPVQEVPSAPIPASAFVAPVVKE